MKLKNFLKQNKIKQKDFAKTLHISEGHLSEITNERHFPSLRLALDIQRETGELVTAKDYITVPKEIRKKCQAA